MHGGSPALDVVEQLGQRNGELGCEIGRQAFDEPEDVLLRTPSAGRSYGQPARQLGIAAGVLPGRRPSRRHRTQINKPGP